MISPIHHAPTVSPNSNNGDLHSTIMNLLLLELNDNNPQTTALIQQYFNTLPPNEIPTSISNYIDNSYIDENLNPSSFNINIEYDSSYDTDLEMPPLIDDNDEDLYNSDPDSDSDWDDQHPWQFCKNAQLP